MQVPPSPAACGAFDACSKDLWLLCPGQGTVFTRLGDTLYIADYCPLRTGCTVLAVDFKKNKELWRTKLKGIGPISHSKYSNAVCIGNDGDTILVFGKEAAGSYREKLDRRTGKTVSNEVFRGR